MILKSKYSGRRVYQYNDDDILKYLLIYIYRLPFTPYSFL